MELIFDQEKLIKLLKSFHTLTGMRIVVFDKDQVEVAAWPEQDGRFCQLVQSNRSGKSCCQLSNQAAFKHCQSDDSLYTYHCHAGLIESMINLKYDNTIIGFIMYGQITNEEKTQDLYQKFADIFSSNGLDNEEMKTAIESILYKDDEQIHAASNILLVLAKYAIQEKILSLSKNAFLKELDAFIDSNISDLNLSVTMIADHFKIGRTKLYEITKRVLSSSIGQHILEKRLFHAETLLKETDLSITEITSRVGFFDYNYFCRTFKKRTGFSPREYRKQTLVN